ncbi:MAG TPA: DNA polymerase III subunit gamma/tau [Oligoflexia bacterium]|nr:DNA polymerase III subunit gamma/tau [Oligoflexia bacterium]HMR24818.1 DNA polymerase III subunit gamma/tau [Oligoflexia bacterium]
MSYVVLARKWRPQSFDDLVGQETIVKIIKNAIRLNRVPHAMLFTGTRGVGKTTSARIVAKALNCENPQDINPCNECTNCKEISASQNIDVIEIDGASNTSVDDIRELKDNVQYAPSKSKYKIFIIDEVHMLSTSAFNALLKTLEEPPSHVKFIFATTEPQKIPDTIHSRCQRFDFKEVAETHLKQHLQNILQQEKINMEPAALDLLIIQAAGSVRDALSLLDQVIALISSLDETILEKDVIDILGLTHKSILDESLQCLSEHSVEGILQVLEKVFQTGVDPKNYLTDLLEKVRDILVIKAGGADHLVRATEEELARLKGLAQTIADEELERWFDLFKNTINELGRSNFAKRLLEVTMIKAARYIPRIDVDDLLEQINAKKGTNLTPVQGKAPAVQTQTSQSLQKAMPVAKPMHEPINNEPMAQNSAQTTDIQDKSDQTHWDQLLQVTKKNKPSYAAILLQSDRHKVENQRIVLGFPKSSFYLERAKEKEFKQYVEELSETLFGEKYQLSIRESGEQSQDETPHSVKQAQAEKTVLEDKKVQETLGLFDAKVDEVNVLK